MVNDLSIGHPAKLAGVPDALIFFCFFSCLDARKEGMKDGYKQASGFLLRQETDRSGLFSFQSIQETRRKAFADFTYIKKTLCEHLIQI